MRYFSSDELVVLEILVLVNGIDNWHNCIVINGRDITVKLPLSNSWMNCKILYLQLI